MWSLLISVSTEIEADIIKGLLDQNQIEVQKKYPLGSLKDSYGIVNGVELWVPSSELEYSRTLINTLTKDPETINEDEDIDKDQYVRGEQEAKPIYKTKSSINKQVLLAILLALAIIIYWLMKGSEIF